MSTEPPRLLTVAFPRLSPEDRSFIDAFRATNDPASARIEPHFSLVFGSRVLDEASYLAHVRSIVSKTAAIRFECCYAMLGADDEDDSAYVFLVPDEGLAAIGRLHDALYTGPLAGSLRLDLPFIPHLTIGRSLAREAMRDRCAELNSRPLRIAGQLDRVCVGSTTSGRFEPLAWLPFGEG